MVTIILSQKFAFSKNFIKALRFPFVFSFTRSSSQRRNSRRSFIYDPTNFVCYLISNKSEFWWKNFFSNKILPLFFSGFWRGENNTLHDEWKDELLKRNKFYSNLEAISFGGSEFVVALLPPVFFTFLS